jgi:alpha-beta hydrolase superfamily lysophospholipase
MRRVEERSFRTFDGVELFYRYWPVAPGARRAGAVVLFHRGHEHSQRVAHLADELGLDDFAFFAWGARGHVRSPGQRGFSPSLGTSVRDVNDFVEHAATVAGCPVEDVAVVTQIVSGLYELFPDRLPVSPPQRRLP